jgi:hypothetical protein
VLALLLLYICLSSNAEVYIPDALRHRVKSAYTACGLSKNGLVEKVELRMYQIGNDMFGISNVVFLLELIQRQGRKDLAR